MAKRSTQIAELIKAKELEIRELREAAESNSNMLIRKQMEKAVEEADKELIHMVKELEDIKREEQLNDKDWEEDIKRYPILAQAQRDTTETGSRISINTSVFRVAENMGKKGQLKNILLYGPTGTGKTTFLQVLGHKLNKPVISINASNGMKEEDIFGSYVLLPNETTGRIEPRFVYGPLVIAMMTGAGFVIEEINGAKQSVLLKLNSVLDDLAKVYIKETGETIKAAPGFFFGGTFNPGYSGTRKLNAALVNRFQIVANIAEMNEVQLRESIKTKIADVTDEELRVSWFVFAGVLNAIKRDALDGAISVRQMISMINFHRADAAEYEKENPGKTKSWTSAIKYAVTGQVSGSDSDIEAAVRIVAKALVDNIDKKTGTLIANPVIPGDSLNKLKDAEAKEESEE